MTDQEILEARQGTAAHLRIMADRVLDGQLPVICIAMAGECDAPECMRLHAETYVVLDETDIMIDLPLVALGAIRVLENRVMRDYHASHIVARVENGPKGVDS
jgi:hypothetical protein